MKRKKEQIKEQIAAHKKAASGKKKTTKEKAPKEKPQKTTAAEVQIQDEKSTATDSTEKTEQKNESLQDKTPKDTDS